MGFGFQNPNASTWLRNLLDPPKDPEEPGNCPAKSECEQLNDDVQRAKQKVGSFSPAACQAGMTLNQLLDRATAWLQLAVARAIRDQKCWAGGDPGHQQAQADAWQT
jgi:type VI secretion system secreted protein VgrG